MALNKKDKTRQMLENVWGRDSCVLMVTISISTATVENNQRCSEKNKSVTLCETTIYFWVYAEKKKQIRFQVCIFP